MIPDADIAILGGGYAGLNLAARLGTKKRVLIIESRPTYTNDATWCFWKTAPHGFEDLVTHRWNRWRISSPQRAIIHDTPETPYEMIPSIAFYDWARERIPKDRLMLDTKAENPQLGSHFLEIPTPKGNITAKYIIDTRPHHATPKLIQEYTEVEIETDAFTYDLETVGLIDFHQGTHFTHTLPLSPSRALIRSSRISSPAKTNKKRLQLDLKNALPNIPHHIIRKESGHIPIGTTASQKALPNSIQTSPHPTNHHFLRINLWAQACTAAILQGHPPIPQPEPPTSIRLINHIFLNALRKKPKKAPSYFLTLATKAPPETLIRLLSNQATSKDILAIIRALPTKKPLAEPSPPLP